MAEDYMPFSVRELIDQLNPGWSLQIEEIPANTTGDNMRLYLTSVHYGLDHVDEHTIRHTISWSALKSLGRPEASKNAWRALTSQMRKYLANSGALKTEPQISINASDQASPALEEAQQSVADTNLRATLQLTQDEWNTISHIFQKKRDQPNREVSSHKPQVRWALALADQTGYIGSLALRDSNPASFRDMLYALGADVLRAIEALS